MERLSPPRPRALAAYLNLVAGLPRLEPAEAAALEARARSGEGEALQDLTEGFLGLVVAEAAAFRGRGVRFEALIAAGNRGLNAALRRGAGPLEDRVRRQVGRRLRLAVARARVQA